MKKRIHRLAHHLKTGGIMRTLSRARLFHDACERYGLVYFGTVEQSDGHEMVRGLTVSTRAIDRHYCVGSVEGYEVILLERTDQLYFRTKSPRVIAGRFSRLISSGHICRMYFWTLTIIKACFMMRFRLNIRG